MNDVYFICCSCKNYIDAGYRWCYANLEHSGIITRGETIDVAAVLAADDYWKGVAIEDKNADWLRRDLPQIRRFLERHHEHKLIYLEAQEFLWNDDELDWLDEEQNTKYVDVSPRFLAERMGFANWDTAIEWVRKERPDTESYYWYKPEILAQVRAKFESLARLK